MEAPIKKSIHQYKNFNNFWLDVVEAYGDRICLIDGEKPDFRLTFADVNDYTDRVAALLQSQGIQHGDRFAVLTENCIEFMLLYLASMKMGSLIVPITPSYSELEIHAILDRFCPKLLFTDNDRIQKAIHCAEKSNCVQNWIPFSQFDPSQTSLIDKISGIDPEKMDYNHVRLSDPGSLYCSSGTTGNPKGIPQSPLNLLTAAESLRRAYGFGSDDTQMGILPVYHTALVTYGFWPGVFAGSAFVLCRRFSRRRFWKDIETQRIAFVETVPTVLSMLLNPAEDIRGYDLSSLKFIGSGSAPLTPTLQKRFEDTFNVSIANKYGLSETEPTHFNPPDPRMRKEGSIGKALDMCRVKVVNENRDELPDGEIGELIFQGRNVVIQYYKDEIETRRAFKEGWFHSGDLGFKTKDGFFYLVGRIKEIIIRGGVNIFPPEIDNLLSTHPKVIEAVTFGMPDDVYGEEVYAAVKIRSDNGIRPSDIINYCEGKLSYHKCPKQIFFMETIPQTASGKPLRRELSRICRQASEHDCLNTGFAKTEESAVN